MDRFTAAADHDSETPPLPAAAGAGLDAKDDTPVQVTLPRASDHWPTAPHQVGPPADFYEIPSTTPARTGRTLFAPTITLSGAPEPVPDQGREPAGKKRRRRPWVIVGALVALSAAIGSGVLLSRTTRSDPQAGAAAAASAAAGTRPAGDLPAPLLPDRGDGGPANAQGAAALPSTTAAVELVSDTTQWAVRTAPLAGPGFRVSTPPDAGITAHATFTDGVLRLTVTPAGAGGSGRVDVLLSDRVTWRVRMTGGAERASFDMGRGTVSRIDLAGGATDIDITLARQASTVPIRMSGGVHSWRIRTEDVIPARILIQRGAGSVVVNGRRQQNIARDTTIRSGSLDKGAGIDVDATAGLGSLRITGG